MENENTILVETEDGEEIEVCGTCYSNPCYCQDIIDQGAGD